MFIINKKKKRKGKGKKKLKKSHFSRYVVREDSLKIRPFWIFDPVPSLRSTSRPQARIRKSRNFQTIFRPLVVYLSHTKIVQISLTRKSWVIFGNRSLRKKAPALTPTRVERGDFLNVLCGVACTPCLNLLLLLLF
jgi:hypothetical protein